MSRLLFMTVLGAGLLLSSQARVQDAAQLEDVDVGANAKCPSTEVLERLAGGRGGATIGKGFTFVITNLAQIYRGASPASPPLQLRPGIFDKVVMFGQTRGTSQRILAAWDQGKDRKCGWMRQEDLVFRKNADAEVDFANGPKPMRAWEIDPDERDSLLDVKAVGANLNYAGSEGVKAYETPDRQVVHQALGLFEIYTVFDRRQGVAPGPRRDDWYYLIGRVGRGEDQMFGWAHSEDIYLWNSRMAASWAGTGKGSGWIDERMNGEPLMRESSDFVEPANEAIPRYPVIEQVPTTKIVQERALKLPRTAKPVDFDRLISRYRIVVPGAACPRSTSEKSQCMSAEELAAVRQKMAEKIASMRRLDVLFLIDGTESMDVYFPSTIEAIQSFAREALGTRDRPADVSVRVAASVYGDYLGSQTTMGIFYQNLAKFYDPSRGDARPLQDLSTYKPSRDSDPVNRDKREAPFAALSKAARETPWDPKSGIRVIIHIADHGNREEGQTSGEVQSTLVETMKLATVIDDLQKQNIIYIPVNVVGRPNESDEREFQARSAFLRQAAAIKSATLAGAGEVVRAYTNSRIQETSDQRRNALLDALRQANEVYLKGTTIVNYRELCAHQPDNNRCAELTALERSGASDSPTQIARRLTEVNGLTREQIANIESRQQTVAYIWVRPVEKNASAEVSTLKYYVALNESGLDSTSRAVTYLCQQMKAENAGANIDLEDGLRRLVSDAADQNVRSSELTGTRLSLPVLEKNPALNIDLKLFERAVRNRDEIALKTWRMPYCKSSYLLGLVGANRRIGLDKIRQDPETGLTSPAEQPQVYHWLVKTGRGEGLNYIPIEYLPQ